MLHQKNKCVKSRDHSGNVQSFMQIEIGSRVRKG
jgi:hypothetical protein